MHRTHLLLVFGIGVLFFSVIVHVVGHAVGVAGWLLATSLRANLLLASDRAENLRKK